MHARIAFCDLQPQNLKCEVGYVMFLFSTILGDLNESVYSRILASFGSAFAHDMPSPVIAKDFESNESSSRTWEGKAKMGGKDVATNVSYKLTSGGTAIIETLAEGTPHEMSRFIRLAPTKWP